MARVRSRTDVRRSALLALLLVVPPPAAAGTGEGRVLLAPGRSIAVETSGGIELLELGLATSLVGFADLRELLPGDRLRYTWSRESAKVKLADTLVVDPPVAADPSFFIAEDALAAALDRHPSPVLLDARPPQAHGAGRLPGARAASSEREAVAALPADPEALVVVYGESQRTGEAHALARALLARGRRNVRVLHGGVQQWVARDRPLEVEPIAAAAALRASTWVVVEVHPKGTATGGRLPGSVVSPADAFRWEEFDGRRALRPMLLVGADRDDPAPRERAERIRRLRSGAEVRPQLRVYLLAGGVAAWKAARLPVEVGGEAGRTAAFRPLVDGEMDPAEFEHRWEERGSTVTYLDVRKNALAAERVVHIPLEQLAARLAELPRDREVVVFCAVGQRARVAYELLQRNGFRAQFLRAAPGR